MIYMFSHGLYVLRSPKYKNWFLEIGLYVYMYASESVTVYVCV